jgi:predicted Rossmann fold nucleotide-binding protein DprA/Smf involved in DNA uptake
VLGAPPARPFLTIVGSRRPPCKALRFAAGVAEEALRLGFAVASGGAEGCDSAAAQRARRMAPGAPALIEILPRGLRPSDECREGCLLSDCEPCAEFSGQRAMERNAHLYALSDFAVVAHARFKEGGTWNGALAAHRRRLCRLLVAADPLDRASRALEALGATPLRRPQELAQAMLVQQPQGELFAREPAAPRYSPALAA